jgi:hypothetical protein
VTAHSNQRSRSKTPARDAWLSLGAVFLIILASILLAEVGHHRRFGHFFGYGVHLDLRRESPLPLAPYKYCWYMVDLSNYGLTPVKLSGYLVESDFMAKTTFELPYRVERWDPNSRTWTTVIPSSPSNRSPNSQSIPAQKTIWPGSSINVVPGILVAGSAGIKKGDTLRFVVMEAAQGSRDGRVFYSPVFKIGQSPTCD